jgi:hypothetical protein
MTNPGHCYEETYDIMLHDDIIAKEGKIVHGKIQDPKTKKWINHAWIEFGTLVIDPTISDGMIRKSNYYEETNAKPEHYYTQLEAINQVFKQKKGMCKWKPSPEDRKSKKPVKKVTRCKCKK